MTFPRLDVDFHLAPFVDPRDHEGVAAARATIGAPHFEREHEFWARPLRVFANSSRADSSAIGVQDVLIRPIGTPENHLLLIIGGAHLCIGKEDEPKFLVDLISRHGTFARHWRHSDSPLAVRLSSSHFSFPEIEGMPNITSAVRLDLPRTRREAKVFPLRLPQENACGYEDPLQFSPDELLDWPTEKIHASIERQFANKNSGLQLAWKWAQILRNKRFEAFFTRPQWSGFLHLTRCILISQAFLSPEIAQSVASWRFLEEHVDYITVKSKPPQFLDSKRCRIWFRAILDVYQRRETQMSMPMKTSLAHYNIRPINPIECAAPTHHEMLEARLQLHEWARENLPPARAAELIALDDIGEEFAARKNCRPTPTRRD